MMSFRSRGGLAGGGGEISSKGMVSKKWTFLLCLGSFCIGLFFTNRMWTMPEANDIIRATGTEDNKMNLVTGDCNPKTINEKQQSKDILGEVSKTHHAIQTLDKTISNLEMELAAARAAQESILNGSPLSENVVAAESTGRRKCFMVVGINTAFSSRKRRDSVRATWMPQGEKRKKLEEEKGIIIRFVIGHSATSRGILDKAIEAEHRKHGDFMRLDHVEGYLELAAKTKTYFATAVATWDADFYVKVDDDVHVNIATLGTTLGRHRSKHHLYIGCMKSGPVLAQKGVRYHEPEYWKFGEAGNKYFRHATGQLYAISKDLATYISINQHVLHKYANEDVSLGAWFIGLDVEHIDDRRLCCGTPPDCEWKAQAGNTCVASFDWSCSGICKSAERIRDVHRRCGEGENALWGANF
ncbi:probable beta-1,3-galactosyltransferase 2 isoform X2 [Elaeis guineensis]|uniref:Hexosyltransferase n=1 Tax=Elaeis guineensis var. tenera TaxID=51953 RepID=A0A6I9RC40_ELAGV|nr:probable beta-1,3-galactosyltransferase 2 isoform X3 [Elaeis guineensis]